MMFHKLQIHNEQRSSSAGKKLFLQPMFFLFLLFATSGLFALCLAAKFSILVLKFAPELIWFVSYAYLSVL